jgi:ankyrin repeat protein
MKFKKTILATFATLLFSYNAIAEDKVSIIKEITSQREECKHTAMHYATSVERYNYVKGLLDRKEFTLYELNSQCQTPLHIAAELGNVAILNLFYDYLGNFESFNSNNDSPIMTAIKNNQHQAILFMVEKGSDLEQKNNEGKSARNYFNDYGDYLSQKILRNHDNKKALANFENSFQNQDTTLSELKSVIEEKQVKILELTKNNADSNVIKALQDEVLALRDKIRNLELIIAKQKQELEELKTLRELYDNNIKSNVEISPAKRINFLETHVSEDKEEEYNKLLENFNKSDEGDINKISEELKLMELLSKPQYKIKNKN